MGVLDLSGHASVLFKPEQVKLDLYNRHIVLLVGPYDWNVWGLPWFAPALEGGEPDLQEQEARFVGSPARGGCVVVEPDYLTPGAEYSFGIRNRITGYEWHGHTVWNGKIFEGPDVLAKWDVANDTDPDERPERRSPFQFDGLTPCDSYGNIVVAEIGAYDEHEWNRPWFAKLLPNRDKQYETGRFRADGKPWKFGRFVTQDGRREARNGDFGRLITETVREGMRYACGHTCTEDPTYTVYLEVELYHDHLEIVNGWYR